MNEEQLIEFINWLPTAVPEFQNASPEQIVQTLNQLYESEEGQATLSQLFTAFQESKNEPQSQMFKKGGKLDQLTQKAKKGKKMCCKKKEIVQGGMVNKVIEKAQDGSKLTRHQALKAGMTNQGYDRSQARIALANAMNTGRNLGMRGKELRQWARQGVAAIPEAPEIDITAGIVAPEPENLTVPVGRFVFDQQSLNPTVDPIKQTFAQAFRGARKNNMDVFTWNGKKYNTQLAETPNKEKSDYQAPSFDYKLRSFSNFVSDQLQTPNREISGNPENYYTAGKRHSYTIRPEGTTRWDMTMDASNGQNEDYYAADRRYSYGIKPENTIRWDMATDASNWQTFRDILQNIITNSRYNYK